MPLHPVLVHLPLAISFLVPPAGLALLVLRRRGLCPPASLWWFFALQLLLFGGGLLARFSGESDKERVAKRVPEGEAVAAVAVLASMGVLGLGVSTAAPVPQACAACSFSSAARWSESCEERCTFRSQAARSVPCELKRCRRLRARVTAV